MEHQFTRIEYLFEENQLNSIKEATVCVVGLGGVGSQALLTLARTGVSKFVICDFDIINITNCNRQIIANLKTAPLSRLVLGIIPTYNEIDLRCKSVIFVLRRVI